MVTWCDKLASTPAVGFRFAPVFSPAEEILSAMSPILDREVDGEKLTFNLEAMDAFSLTFNTESGFRYQFDSAASSITFNHRVKAKPASGGPPTVELISRPAPYSKLLDTVIEKISESVGLLPRQNERLIKRFGIVSLTHVDIEDAPPGIVSLFKDLGKPLGGEVESFQIAITTIIGKTDDFYDRCLHTLTFPEKKEDLLIIQLDWQRTFTEPKAANPSFMRKLMQESKGKALKYFDRFAEGGLGDAIDSDS